MKYKKTRKQLRKEKQRTMKFKKCIGKLMHKEGKSRFDALVICNKKFKKH